MQTQDTFQDQHRPSTTDPSPRYGWVAGITHGAPDPTTRLQVEPPSTWQDAAAREAAERMVHDARNQNPDLRHTAAYVTDNAVTVVASAGRQPGATVIARSAAANLDAVATQLERCFAIALRHRLAVTTVVASNGLSGVATDRPDLAVLCEQLLDPGTRLAAIVMTDATRISRDPAQVSAFRSRMAAAQVPAIVDGSVVTADSTIDLSFMHRLTGRAARRGRAG